MLSFQFFWRFEMFLNKNLKKKKKGKLCQSKTCSFSCGLPSWYTDVHIWSAVLRKPAAYLECTFCTWGWSLNHVTSNSDIFIFLNCSYNPIIPLKFLLCFLVVYTKINFYLRDMGHEALATWPVAYLSSYILCHFHSQTCK